MDIGIEPAFKEAGVDVSLGWITADVRVTPSKTVFDQKLSQAVEDLKALAIRPQDHPIINASRRAYKALGKDPSRYRPAAEALMRRIMQGKPLFKINNIIDINNMISLRTGLSIGSYDRDAIRSPIALRPAIDGEEYHGIGRGPLHLTGLPVLTDKTGPFGSPTSDSERSMVHEETHRILMVFYGLNAPVDGFEKTLDLLKDFGHAENLEHGVTDNRPMAL